MVFLLCCFPWRLPVDPFAYFVLWTPNIYLWEKLLKEQNLFGDLRTGIYIICMRSLEQKKRIKKNHHFWEASKEPWKVPPSLSLSRPKQEKFPSLFSPYECTMLVWNQKPPIWEVSTESPKKMHPSIWCIHLTCYWCTTQTPLFHP